MLKKTVFFVLLASLGNSMLSAASSTPIFQQYQAACQERDAKKAEAVLKVEELRAEIAALQKNTPKEGHRWGHHPSMYNCAILDRGVKKDDTLDQTWDTTYSFGEIGYTFCRPWSNKTKGTEAGITEIEETLANLRDQYNTLEASCNELWKQSVYAAKAQLAHHFPQYLAQVADGTFQLTDDARQMSRPKNFITLARQKPFFLRAVLSGNTAVEQHDFMACFNILELAERQKHAEVCALLTQEGNDLLQALVQGSPHRAIAKSDYNNLFASPEYHQVQSAPIDASIYDLSGIPAVTEATILGRVSRATQNKDQAQAVYDLFIRDHSRTLAMRKNPYDRSWDVAEEFEKALARHEKTEREEEIYSLYQQLKQRYDAIIGIESRAARSLQSIITRSKQRLQERFPEYLTDVDGYREPQLTTYARSLLQQTSIAGIYVVKLDVAEPERSYIGHFIARYNALELADDYRVESIFSPAGIEFAESMFDKQDEVLWSDKPVTDFPPLVSYNNLFVAQAAHEPEPQPEPVEEIRSAVIDPVPFVDPLPQDEASEDDDVDLPQDTTIRAQKPQESPSRLHGGSSPFDSSSSTSEPQKINYVKYAARLAWITGGITTFWSLKAQYAQAKKELKAEQKAENKNDDDEEIAYSEIVARMISNLKEMSSGRRERFICSLAGIIFGGLGDAVLSAKK